MMFNKLTCDALYNKISGYVDKTKHINKYSSNHIYRFDLGENIDGFSPKINKFLKNKNKEFFENLNQYPDTTYKSLCEKIGIIYNVSPKNIVVSNGLDSIIDLVTRIFFECDYKFLIAVPDFFLFESYSKRMGASFISIQLKEENNYVWTNDTYQEFNELLIKHKPKIVLLSNPNNPTGQVIPEERLIEMIELANLYNVLIVVDEAYHEFIANPLDSIAKYLNKYKNLIVLRSFSKAIGLAGIRVGYLMCANEDIIDALMLYRHHFPITQTSLNIALEALNDIKFLYKTQEKTKTRRKLLFKDLDTLDTFKYIPSLTNIFMLKNKHMNANELQDIFRSYGIISSSINMQDNIYLRLTIRTEEDNKYLFNVCQKIHLTQI
jgi:histidinol-phosphate aminotransferase